MRGCIDFALVASLIVLNLGCLQRGYNSAVTSERETQTGAPRDHLSEADGGLILPKPTAVISIPSILQTIDTNLLPILENKTVLAKIEGLNEQFLTKGLALMVSGFEWREGQKFCGALGPCEGAALFLESYSPMQKGTVPSGLLLLRKSSRDSQAVTADFSEKFEKLSVNGYTLGSPVSLNVFNYFIRDHVTTITASLKTMALPPTLDAVAKQAQISPNQILVTSMLSATAGSSCRSTEHPCRNSYFRLVAKSVSNNRYTDLGTLMILDYLNENDSMSDSARLLVGEDRHSAEYFLVLDSPTSIDTVGPQIVGSPSYVSQALDALRGDAFFSAERTALTNKGSALMLTQIAAKNSSKNATSVVTFSLETYSPARSNVSFGDAVVTLTSGSAQVKIIKN